MIEIINDEFNKINSTPFKLSETMDFLTFHFKFNGSDTLLNGGK